MCLLIAINYILVCYLSKLWKIFIHHIPQQIQGVISVFGLGGYWQNLYRVQTNIRLLETNKLGLIYTKHNSSDKIKNISLLEPSFRINLFLGGYHLYTWLFPFVCLSRLVSRLFQESFKGFLRSFGGGFKGFLVFFKDFSEFLSFV